MELFLRCNDNLQALLNEVLSGSTGAANNAELLAQLEGWMSGEFTELQEESESSRDDAYDHIAVTETPVIPVELSSTKLSEVEMLKQAAALFVEPVNVPKPAEEWVDLEASVKPEPTEPRNAAVLNEPKVNEPMVEASPGATNKPEESLRVSLERVDQLINYVGELVILENVIREQSGLSGSLTLKKSCNQLSKIVSEIQDLSMGLRMITLKQSFQKMHRIVRDTAGLVGKSVRLEIQGEETEVDKTILEQLKDPLVHLVRNAVDHGLESPEVRERAGKPAEGRIQLKAYHQSGRIIIDVEDDGAGINPERLLAKAIERKILPAHSKPTKEECFKLLFHPGFSMKEKVTEISGRGVGLDVVKTNLEALQGSVTIESELGRGTLFRISLPLTLSIIEGMLVRCHEHRFVVPLNQVYETVQVQDESVHHLTGIGPILRIRGENLALFNLSELLKFKAKAATDEGTEKERTAIVVRMGGDPFAVVVDEIVGRHQVVIKSVGNQLQHLSAFSGSAILGDGKPSLILELPALVRAKNSNQEGRKWA